MYYAHGTPDYRGYLFDGRVGLEFAGEYCYISNLVNTSDFAFYKALVQNEKLSQKKNFKKVYQDSPDSILPSLGMYTLQRVRMFNIKYPTLEELELEKKLVRRSFMNLSIRFAILSKKVPV